jgi:hypothetical protein
LHEASIIATKERAEMKMIEFFIARKIVVDGAGDLITKRRARKACRNRRWHHGRIICHPAIKNDSKAATRMAAHRKLDRRRDDQ